MARVTETYENKDLRKIQVSETSTEQTFQRGPQPEPPAKFTELSLVELTEKLAEATATLAAMDEEITGIKSRAAEIKNRLNIAEKALVAAQDENKAQMIEFARGRTDAKAVADGQAAIRDLENEIAGLKALAEIIAAELTSLLEPRAKQAALVENRHSRAWAIIKKTELEKARPHILRAMAAGLQQKDPNSDKFIEELSRLIYEKERVTKERSDELTRERADTLSEEYGLPIR